LAVVRERLDASGKIPEIRPSAARGPEVASRVGIALGISITICFATGLISHWIQHPPSWFYYPANPPWLYRVTQGAHVISGVMAIPLLLVKLWSVMPKLIERPGQWGKTKPQRVRLELSCRTRTVTDEPSVAMCDDAETFCGSAGSAKCTAKRARTCRRARCSSTR
jgi:hypothetical protein